MSILQSVTPSDSVSIRSTILRIVAAALLVFTLSAGMEAYGATPVVTGVASKQTKKNVDKSVLVLQGRVRDAIARKDVLASTVFVTDSAGCKVDSLTAGGWFYGDGKTTNERAMFSFKVPRRPGTYYLEVSHPEYQTSYVTIEVGDIGRREFTRNIDDIFLQRAPKQLKDVTVTASKIKFYNKGDTLVYNADAFDLAEGSMLDALIKQLPGVELREGGQIFVNGEFVENLMLNGKDFFKGKNELMLDNLSAYAVKNIEVYRRSDDLARWSGDKGQQQLVMDVQLKREYNVGWMMNFEGGLGSAERYMARAFVSRFTNNSRVSFIGSVNNLNDNRKPGESSTWTPETNTAGTMKTIMAGLDYNVQDKDERWKVNGDATVRRTSQTDQSQTDRMNFLGSDRNYEYRFMNNHTRSLALTTSHTLSLERRDSYFLRTYLRGDYNRVRSRMSTVGGAFNDEQSTITSGMLDTLYSGNPEALKELINRTRTNTLSSAHRENFKGGVNGGIKVPNTSDYIFYGADFGYSSDKSEVWRDFMVNYGTNPQPALRENRYFDDSPNRGIRIDAHIGYQYSFADNTRLTLTYNYDHSNRRRDSYAYALDRLADQGIFGTLPEGYLTQLDASQSYRSRTIENNHTAALMFTHWSSRFMMYLRPVLKFTDVNFDYFRNNTPYRVDQRKVLFSMAQFEGRISWNLGDAEQNGRKFYRHTLTFLPALVPTMPDPARMVNVIDDTDPMNIRTGNPGLKPSVLYKGFVQWFLRAPIRNYMLNLMTEFVYADTRNELVNGYRYDTATGVRTFRTYNVASGNTSTNFHVSPSLQFGRKGQFTLRYFAGLDYIRATDMIGIDADPVKSQVYTYWNVQKLDFTWQLGKQRLGLHGELNSRHTGSDRPDFSAITGTHANVAVNGQFSLPRGFGISSDFTVYMRRGYGSPEFNRTEPVLNARLSYTPPKSRWVIMLDGFDLFHQLSNVSYTANAQGRTVVWNNVLPRYVMLHLQYRLHLQPKKKIIDTRPEWSR